MGKITKPKWKPVGKLDKKTAFSKYPMESLHAEIKRLFPKITEVMQVGVSEKTNAYLRTKMEAYARKKYKHWAQKYIDTTVAMEMLQYSPCDVADAEDFQLYVRN